MYCPDDGSELAKLADKLKIGSVFSDRYEIVSFVGAGGCSIIYEARQHADEKACGTKVVAIEFFHPRPSMSSAFNANPRRQAS